jgi:hypothetical protein
MDTGICETLQIESESKNTYKGGWFEISTFALAHPNSYIRTTDGVYRGQNFGRYRYNDPLPGIQWRNLFQINIHERQSVESTKKYQDLQSHASSIDTEQVPQLITYGPDETFWQALSTFELAQNDYIVFPEALSGRWTHGIPDLSCFHLGELQRVLADLGVVPGGASLEEIELRAKYDMYESTQTEVNTTVGVVEAKREESASDGRRQLASSRGRNKPPYLDGSAIEKGWLVSPNATRIIESNDSAIGGVTWESGDVVYIEPSEQDANPTAKNSVLNDAKYVVLHTVLQYQELPHSLRETIGRCIEEPEYLYDIL